MLISEFCTIIFSPFHALYHRVLVIIYIINSKRLYKKIWNICCKIKVKVKKSWYVMIKVFITVTFEPHKPQRCATETMTKIICVTSEVHAAHVKTETAHIPLKRFFYFGRCLWLPQTAQSGHETRSWAHEREKWDSSVTKWGNFFCCSSFHRSVWVEVSNRKVRDADYTCFIIFLIYSETFTYCMLNTFRDNVKCIINNILWTVCDWMWHLLKCCS